MNIATIKKWAFITGIIILVINVLGIFSIRFNLDDPNFDFPVDLFFETLSDKRSIPFAVLSILSSALLIYGITPINNIVNFKRSKAVFTFGIGVLVYLIITLLTMNSGYDSFESYWANAFLLFISSAAMIVFGVKFSINKEANPLEENEKPNENIN